MAAVSVCFIVGVNIVLQFVTVIFILNYFCFDAFFLMNCKVCAICQLHWRPEILLNNKIVGLVAVE